MVNTASHVSAGRGVRDDQKNSSPTQHEALDTEGLPVDKGYAWVIAFASMFNNALHFGIHQALSILFVEFVFMFRKSVAETSLIFSVQAGAAIVGAILTQMVLMSFLSERQLVVMGGFVGGLGMTLSFFAQSVYTLYVTIGILLGISTSFILNPTLVIINKYFNKRRSLATSISMLGISLGSIVYPIYTQTLVTEYGVRGAMMVLGATCLNVMVGGMLLRPFHLNKRKTGNDGKHSIALEEVIALTSSEDDSEACDPESSDTMDVKHGTASTRHETDEEKSAADENKYEEDLPQDLTSEKDDRKTIPENSDQSTQPTQPHGKTNSCQQILAALDLSLLKLPIFWMFLVISCFSSVAVIISVYVPSLAEERGISPQEAAVLLTILCASSTASYLLIGYLADLNFIRRSTLLALILVFTSALTFLVPVYHTFATLAVFCFILGFLSDTPMSLLPVVMVDLMGLSRMSKTLGYQALTMGAMLSGCHFLVGYLRDVTGSYDVPFIFMACCTMVGSLCLFATPLVERLQVGMRQGNLSSQEPQ